MAPVKNRGLQKQSAANNRLLDPVFFSDQCFRASRHFVEEEGGAVWGARMAVKTHVSSVWL